jgi:hypothetical protein
MKGKIDKEGVLLIERAGKIKGQYCCSTSTREVACCDMCPQFGEPEGEGYWVDDSNVRHDQASINICHGRSLCFSDFIDERIKP